MWQTATGCRVQCDAAEALRPSACKRGHPLPSKPNAVRRGANMPEPDPRMQPYIKIVLPNTLHKTVYEKQFIAKEARTACENLAKGGSNAHTEAIDCLVEGFKEFKHLPLTEQAAIFLPELLKKMPLGFFSTPSPSLV